MPGSGWETYQTPFARGSAMRLRPYPGISWLPLIKGNSAHIRDAVVIENDDPTTGYRVRCLVTDRYRLTLYPGTPDGELFDYREDPWELHNLWYKCAYNWIKEKLMIALLDSYRQHTPLYPIPPWNS